MHVFGLLTVPVNVGHHTAHRFLAIKAQQLLIQLTSLWGSLRIDGLLTNPSLRRGRLLHIRHTDNRSRQQTKHENYAP